MNIRLTGYVLFYAIHARIHTLSLELHIASLNTLNICTCIHISVIIIPFVENREEEKEANVH